MLFQVSIEIIVMLISIVGATFLWVYDMVKQDKLVKCIIIVFSLISKVRDFSASSRNASKANRITSTLSRYAKSAR
jgi:hypothetical protein